MKSIAADEVDRADHNEALIGFFHPLMEISRKQEGISLLNSVFVTADEWQVRVYNSCFVN